MSWSSSRWQQQALLFLASGDSCLENKSELEICLISDIGVERAAGKDQEQTETTKVSWIYMYFILVRVTNTGQFINPGFYICVISSCLYF